MENVQEDRRERVITIALGIFTSGLIIFTTIFFIPLVVFAITSQLGPSLTALIVVFMSVWFIGIIYIFGEYIGLQARIIPKEVL